MPRPMVLMSRRGIFLFLFLAASAGLSYAWVEKVEKPAQKVEVPKEAGLPNEINSYVRYLPYSGVEAMPGKIGIMQFGGEYCRELKLFGKLPVDVSLDFDYTNIDKTVETPLPAALVSVSLDLETKLPLFDLLGGYVGCAITPSLAGDRYSFDGDGFLMPARFLFIYKFKNKESLIAAVGAEFFSNFENRARLIGGVIYKPNDRLAFNLVTENPNITYKVMNKLDLFVEGGYNIFDQFKVRREDNRNVILEYWDTRIGGGFNFRPVKNVSASVAAGGVFDRLLKYPDAGGKMDIEKGMYLEGRALVEF